MNRESCERYLEDPEANASHLASCEDCRAFDASLRDQSSVLGPRSSVAPEAMPMAAWEGASHKSWPLVAAGLIALAVIAILLCAAAGTSPLEVLKGNVPSGDILSSMVRLAPGFIQNAPRSWQVFIVAAFVVVNAIFVALLRRAPKGLDV
jgi:hypothetical protein